MARSGSGRPPGKTREQCRWVHKTSNVLAKLPKSQQPKAKRALQEIWMAETKVAESTRPVAQDFGELILDVC
jgi:hypothetical protein